MHFLTYLLQNSMLKNPAEDYQEIHKHLTRYSKGEFTGPVIKVRFTANKITLSGSFEYEDFIQEYVVSVMSDNEIEVKLDIIAGLDLKIVFPKLGLDWQLKKSTGKIKNFKGTFQEKFSKSRFLEVIKELNKHSYYFINFNDQQGFSVKSKTKPPQPSKKKLTHEEFEKLTKFCVGTVKKTKKNQKILYEKLIPDFEDKIPDTIKIFKLINMYKINNIIIPKGLKNTSLIRLKAIREGKLVRTIEINDDMEYANSLTFSV